jgi:hypothetical protein
MSAWLAVKKCSMLTSRTHTGSVRSITGASLGSARIASGWPASPSIAITPSPVASSACACDTATGSLSTYATRAPGTMARALSCTLGDVGRPAPMSRYCAMPAPATRRTAAARNARFALATVAALGSSASNRSAACRSAAKCSFPPSR